jgi:hypothetical protein
MLVVGITTDRVLESIPIAPSARIYMYAWCAYQSRRAQSNPLRVAALSAYLVEAGHEE